MQHRDIPENDIKNDKLNFAPFASRVSKGILNYSQDETFILSLEGEWGSGKTTLINFIKSDIKNDVEIVHFNPWLITDIRQVIKLFFDELMKVILSITTDAKKDEFTKDVRKLISFILPDDVTVGVGDVAKVKYNIAKRLEDKNRDNLEKVKEKINTYLKKLDKKIVIIIDDIDRLTDKETEFIFRLVKGIADFDNLIYILLYDKNVVSNSLLKFKAEKGQKYLEKIVQYPLSVPKPHKITIRNLLFKELDEILTKLECKKVKYIFNKETWSEVHSIVGNYIKTIRDINQIVNIISFEYPIIAEEVNFTDFFIISLIKLKKHTLYELIQNKPSDFFINTNTGYSKEEETKRIQENFSNNLKEFHDFEDLLKISFSIFKEYDYRTLGGHKNKGISNFYYFENYFSFSTSDDKISMKEYYEIKNSFINNDFEVLKKVVLKADEQQKSSYFLDMFYEFNESIEKNEIENMFFNTLKISKDLVSKDKSTFSLFNVSISYEQLGYDVLIKHPKVDDFILNFYKTDSEIEFKVKVNLLRSINEEIAKTYSDKKLKVSDATLAKLNSIVKSELESITYENMSNYSGILNLVHSFNLFNASIDVLSKDIENNIFKSPNDFFKILDIFQSYRIVNGSYKEYYISKESLEKLIKLEVVEEYINELDKSKLLEGQGTLLEYWRNNDKF
ncbi:KAP family P-loop NTPase fold protein [Sulfurimonas sp.]|uniref:KAP family P-loop NTPase fold protein n=1 Tax=Sulfurimonas sp. TaxID=2022749 RepID=UPI002B4782DF|nr:P-loop NTPase fold protein [Sulfurimonas sp.]